MKHIKYFMLLTLMTLSSSCILATGLTFKYCSLDIRAAYWPLRQIYFTYQELLSLNDSTAKVYKGDEVIAEGKLAINNYHGHDSSNASTTQQGTVEVMFDEALVLPKGETFTVVIGEGTFYKEGEPDIDNDEVRYSFTIPTDLGEFDADIEDGSTLTSENLITFYWETETKSDGEQMAILYREGEAVREFPFHANWDWDLGQACVDFGDKMNFEKGVNFALEIPEGIVYAMYRPDITNKKAVLHFVGGYEEPLPSINYVWCSLFDNHPKDVLGEVSFYYNQAVMLSSDPKVQLWYDDNSEMVKEVEPTLAEEDGQWVLKADFENTLLTSEKGYTIVIPDGTLISANGDVVVNSRRTVNMDEASEISQIGNDALLVRAMKGGIDVKGLPTKTNVTVCGLNGKVIYNTTPKGANVMIPVNKGIYTVKIGDTLSRKVLVKR